MNESVISFIRGFVVKKPVSVIKSPLLVIKKEADFYKESMHAKACFYNSLLASISMDCKLVIGYLINESPSLPIEHSWNMDEFGHFDLTCQFFNPRGIALSRYHSIIIEPEEAYRLMGIYGEVNHDLLAKTPDYKKYFIF